MPGVSSPDDPEYKVTEVSVQVSRKKQIEDFEPFEVTEQLTADVVPGADLDEVTEELHDLAKEHVQRDIIKRVDEREMKEQLEG